MTSTKSLDGQTALITGASRGLGQHFAQVLAAAGCQVIVTARDSADLAVTCELISKSGGVCHGVDLDVRDHQSIQDCVKQSIEIAPKIDILVNNAGCNVRKPAVEITWDDWNLVVDTNLRGSFFVAQAVARDSMIPNNYGRVINIGSVTSVFGYEGLTPYGASRGGTKQMTMSLADDWGQYGIAVNCLAPGWFKTAQNAVMYEDSGWVDYLSERIPMGRPGHIDDLNDALLFLASPGNKYYTGQTLLVDGGITVGRTRALPKS
jgi:gluconate 5-dehydrogenase